MFRGHITVFNCFFFCEICDFWFFSSVIISRFSIILFSQMWIFHCFFLLNNTIRNCFFFVFIIIFFQSFFCQISKKYDNFLCQNLVFIVFFLYIDFLQKFCNRDSKYLSSEGGISNYMTTIMVKRTGIRGSPRNSRQSSKGHWINEKWGR